MPRPAPKESNGDGPGLAHALRLFGTKRVMPERVILQERLAASNAAGCLIHCFDRISADGLDRLVTVRAKVSPGLRFEEGLCLLKAVPFRDCHALGWGWTVQADNLSAACTEITTPYVRLCSLDALCNTRSGLSIERFDFADGVSSRLGLSV